ncbi:prephenate dehydratase [Methanohalobium sp.]|uniref:prephenate dehydratase n=1 Tax=Methanohalobium sp. TaxID=2837493 RepID=UPI0025FCA371|nr:prephenate dehydratase [Methanohalobium sp.]
MIVGVLGPAGSYSEKAAKKWSKKLEHTDVPVFNYYEDITDTFSAIVDKTIDFGVVPVENSIEGSIGITLDQLFENEITITGEIVVPIEHCLLSKGSLSDIKIILSHPQALAQCRNFLKTHFKNIELRTTGSTSHAAKLATEFDEMAAIASRSSAEMYGLKILIPNIQDHNENYTRFLVIKSKNKTSNIKSNPTVHLYKTSIIVYLDQNRPGALYEILEEFAKKEINLTKIESRPSKKALGDYLFYIDFEGSIQDEIIKDALDNLGRKVNMLKNLGSYPKDN